MKHIFKSKRNGNIVEIVALIGKNKLRLLDLDNESEYTVSLEEFKAGYTIVRTIKVNMKKGELK